MVLPDRSEKRGTIRLSSLRDVSAVSGIDELDTTSVCWPDFSSTIPLREGSRLPLSQVLRLCGGTIRQVCAGLGIARFFSLHVPWTLITSDTGFGARRCRERVDIVELVGVSIAKGGVEMALRSQNSADNVVLRFTRKNESGKRDAEVSIPTIKHRMSCVMSGTDIGSAADARCCSKRSESCMRI